MQTRLAYYASSRKARAILGQRRSTIDLREVIAGGGVLLVSTSQATAGPEVSALVGASLLNLVDAVIREQGRLPSDQRRGALVVVDEMQAMPGVDYESMLSELGKFGASFILATRAGHRGRGADGHLLHEGEEAGGRRPIGGGARPGRNVGLRHPGGDHRLPGRRGPAAGAGVP